jgi:hypothetical protein
MKGEDDENETNEGDAKQGFPVGSPLEPGG